MQVIGIKWCNGHDWQLPAKPGLQGADQTKSDYLSWFQLISGLKK